MADALDALRLTPAQLAELRDTLAARIREGLTEDEREIRALPAHLPPPPAGLAGEALVVDTGGTNMRAAVVALAADGGAKVVKGPVQARLPMREEGGADIDADGFFALQADLAARLDSGAGLPLGYCFSYPSAVLPSRDARLIRWTKGIDVPGVEGALVGDGLARALGARGLAPCRVAVVNDTVASLLAGAQQAPGRPRDMVGLIAGTGTNMAGFYDARQAPKLAAFPGAGTMAVNLESGNFDPPHLTALDRAVDEASNNPGQQRFEKAVSGFYLPFLLAAALPEAGVDPEAGTGPLVGWRDAGEGRRGEVAGLLLDRSADMIAAGLAAAITTYPADALEVGILAEGSLFWRATGYSARVQATLPSLLPAGRRCSVLRIDEANLVGAAAAALTP
ncbi:MAG: hypothetical protein H6730_20835 [Deltaproteobacteria bacterium]|nr:hypothetical protein [Deltaproteobacteria bacterium]